MANDLSHDELFAIVRDFLDASRTGSLATVDAEGKPHGANLQLVRAAGDSLDLFWVSSPESAHSRHIADRPDAALTIYAHDDTAANIHGLQLHGQAVAVPEEEAWDLCWDLYTRKYPVVTTMPQVREMVEAGHQQFYRFAPSWLRWIDNRRGFGWKVEATL